MFGAFIGGWTGDKLGRRRGVFIGGVLSFLVEPSKQVE
jgi:MFS family permease